MTHRRLPRLAAMALVGALLARPPAALALAADGAPYSLSFLRAGTVAGPSGLLPIVDARGRTVLLRGVNVNGLEDYWQNSSTPLAVPYPIDRAAYDGGACPARNPAVESMSLCALDLEQMRAFGYNSIRLAVSWSLLEPAPGQMNSAYIARIQQVVGWAAAAGMYTVIDMHQDAWSKFIYTPASQPCPPAFSRVEGFHESDGAPEWASAHNAPVCALAGVRELDAAVQEDFDRFWLDVAGPDGVGLQEHHAAVMVALARQFHDQPAVAGYEVMNEPSPGFTAGPEADHAFLFPFYAKVTAALTGGVPGFQQLIFVEPNILRDQTDQSLVLTPWSVYSPYPNVVYSPHVYTRVFTPDQALNAAAGTPYFFPLNGGYDSAVRDAKQLGLPLWVGEFGNDVPDDETILRAHYGFQDGITIGSSIWVWKADEHAQFSVEHGPFGAGAPFPSRVKFTSRAYPLFTAGALRGVTYEPDTGAFQVRGSSPAVACGNTDQATVIFVPAVVRGPITATGAALQVVGVPGGRIALAFPAGGDYSVGLGTGAAPTTSCAAAEARVAPLPTAAGAPLPNTSKGVSLSLLAVAPVLGAVGLLLGMGSRRRRLSE